MGVVPIDYLLHAAEILGRSIDHYQKLGVCRVLKYLLSAFYRALGKEAICRVLSQKHSAKDRHLAEINLPSAVI